MRQMMKQYGAMAARAKMKGLGKARRPGPEAKPPGKNRAPQSAKKREQDSPIHSHFALTWGGIVARLNGPFIWP